MADFIDSYLRDGKLAVEKVPALLVGLEPGDELSTEHLMKVTGASEDNAKYLFCLLYIMEDELLEFGAVAEGEHFSCVADAEAAHPAATVYLTLRVRRPE